MSNWLADYIVVGSGLSGVQAAQTLTEAGCDVAMIDAGVSSSESVTTGLSFIDHRRQDQEQYKHWLGKDLSGLPQPGIRTGSQISPSRKHINYLADVLTPFTSESFFPMESLATGGLGISWGLGCCGFSAGELELAGLPVKDMQDSYQVIADRIGLSYTADDIADYTLPGINNIQPGITVDANSERLLKTYSSRRTQINKKDFFLGKASLALLTEDKDGRQATPYNEMDFYSHDNAAYRPAITLDLLKKSPRFRHLPGLLVTHFEERDEFVRVHYLLTNTKSAGHYDCKKLVLAANVTATARIVLRSAGQYETRLPLLCNHYSYVPCLQWSMLGKADTRPRTATAQLFLFHDPDRENTDVATASLYSYRSLMMFRLMNMVPLNSRDGRIFMQYLLPAITIAGIHQPDRISHSKYLWIEKDPSSFNNIILKAVARFENQELLAFAEREKLFLKTLRRLGCYPIKKINPGYGASIHYAGSLPYSIEEKPLRLLPDGRLSFSKNIYIADGSGFCFLPAKGISFSLMANAHRTAINILKQ